MPEDRHETYQLQTSPGKWVGGLSIQKGHSTIGGKVYPTVKLPNGDVWMAQNLELIWQGLYTLTDYSDSYRSTSCAYWEFDQENYGDKGLFYNWQACVWLRNHVSTLTPGWHVPEEVVPVREYLGYARAKDDIFGLVSGFGMLYTGEGNGWHEDVPYVTDDLRSYFLQIYNSGWSSYGYLPETEAGLGYPSWSTFSASNNPHIPIRLMMDDPSLFVPDTTEYLNVRATYTKYWHPWVVLEFSDSSFVPTWTLNSGLSSRTYNARWERVSTSPNRWKCTVTSCSNVGNTGSGYGLAFLFDGQANDPYDPVLIPANMNGGTCKIIDWGNLDNTTTMDRFAKANTGITQIPSTISFGPYITNVNEMFSGCTEVTGGALALYNVMKDIPTITSHADTFKNTGLNSQSGLAELQQIPLSWGGLMAPPSTTMTCARVESSNPKVKWSCGSTAPDWSTEPELYVFTENSVSQYAGVNMRKTSITNKVNGIVTSGAATYYRVAFVQFVSGSSGELSWVLTTTGYNGTLSASASAGDMPGTLSYDNFGATDKHYGTYDSGKTVYMAFLVTNAAPENWGGLTDAYGLQGNNFFNAGVNLKWFTA